MFLIENRYAPELSEANRHARLRRLIKLLKNICVVMSVSFDLLV